MQGVTTAAWASAWLGGAAFVASLAWFLWCYGVAFGRPAQPGPVAAPVAVNVLLFTVFALHHSVLARSGAKRWVSRLVPAPLERTTYVWVASGLFALVCAWWQPVPGVLYARSGLAALPHWVVVAAGLWLTAQSVRVLDPLELAGIRQATGTTRPPSLDAVGPYRLVRHPIYLGSLLLFFGVPHMTATRLTCALVSLAYIVVAIPFEERSLTETLGDGYRAYRGKVRWRLVPGIW